MARRGNKSTAAIQKLLEERRKIEQWLRRLEMAADQTAADVRDRVRGDYQLRLDKVVGELQEYGDDLRTSLESQRATYADFKSQETTATEELAEAELRHAVGEFDEEEWGGRKAGILQTLVKIREGLALAESKMSELEEVLRQMEASAPAAEPEAQEQPAPAAEPRVSLGGDLGLRDLGPSAPLDAPKEREPVQKEAFGDELAFLKSVTEDDRQGPDHARAVGRAQAVTEKPAPVPEEAVPPAEVGTEGIEKLSGQRAVGDSRPSAVNQRTLKCGECGAMNLPTEWYCDRCGAELAAL